MKEGDPYVAWLDVENTPQKQNAEAIPRQRWRRQQLHLELHTLDLKWLLSNHGEMLWKLRVYKKEVVQVRRCQ